LDAGLLFQRHKLPSEIFNLAGALTPPNQCRKSLHVGQCSPGRTKASVAPVPLKLGLGNPVEATPVTESSEFETWYQQKPSPVVICGTTR
jgi:hypothetical protein